MALIQKPDDGLAGCVLDYVSLPSFKMMATDHDKISERKGSI